MPAEEQFRLRNDTLNVGFADVVQVDAAALDVFSCLTLAGTKASQDEQVDQRQSRPGDGGLLDFLRRRLANDLAECALGNAFESAAKQNFAGPNRLHGRCITVNE